MAKALPGSLVNIYYDSPVDIAPGDALKTPSGRTYIIADIRIQKRGKHVGRKHLKCVVSDGAMAYSGATHPIYWYPRKKRK